MEKERERASRIYRLKNPPQMRMTDRDKLTIKAVNDFRIMRQDQVQRLLYPSKNTAQKRLWLLWQHQFLKRAYLPVMGGVQTSPILYMVDKRGVELLQSEFEYTKEQLRYSPKSGLSYRFLEHTLGLGEIRLSVELSCKSHNFTLADWHDEKKIKSDYDRVDIRGKRGISVVPDSYFKIKIDESLQGSFIYLHFFIEYDRGKEHLTFFRQKIHTYNIYFQSGKCRKRYGTNRVRVLTVTEGGVTRKGRGRHKSVQAVTKGARAKDWFWFTSLENVIDGDFFLTPIWEQTHTEQKSNLLTF